MSDRRLLTGIAVAATLVALAAMGLLVVMFVRTPPSVQSGGEPASVSADSAAPSSTLTPSPSFSMRGAFDLFAGDTGLHNGDECRGIGPYQDINIGTPVRVYDTSGKVLTVGSLTGGAF